MIIIIIIIIIMIIIIIIIMKIIIMIMPWRKNSIITSSYLTSRHERIKKIAHSILAFSMHIHSISMS